MKKIPSAELSLDDFLRDPIIVRHRPGDESDEKKSESAEPENATPAVDAGDVDNRNTN